MTHYMERDAGFCSGGEEDDGIHSPTDASEDSVDVKVQAISLKNKNKRKCAEPRRVDIELPAKKRKIVSDNDAETVKNRFNSNSSPFRPWSRSPQPISKHSPPHPVVLPILADYYGREPPRLPIQVPPSRPSPCFPTPVSLHQEEPLSLVSKKKHEEVLQRTELPMWHTPEHAPFRQTDTRISKHRIKSVKSETNTECSASEDNNFRIESLLSSVKQESLLKNDNQKRTSHHHQGNQPRNYKNMTRERRIEANARERTRVHTISAAFDTLRQSVPAYSHNQKLSKLSVLRIACSYIMTLSRLAGYDYSAEQSEPDLASCIDNVSRTIQTEGKLRKKKED